MNRNGLVARVAKEYNMTIQDTRAWVDAIFYVLGKSIVEEDVVIYGFGSFKHRDRAPRVARDIYRNKEIVIPARKAVQFELSDKLLEELNPNLEVSDNAETDES